MSSHRWFASPLLLSPSITSRVALTALVLATTALASTALAADHGDAPETEADPAADISDIYAWHADGVLAAILTFDGQRDPEQTVRYDADVLYGIHIDTDGDVSNGAEIEVWARYGQNALGEWGIQVQNLPGADGVVVGPVQTVLEQSGVRVWTGLADDPFFFDRAGLIATLSTGDLGFTGADAVAGLNATGIVVEMDLADDAFDDSTTLQVWATTARL